MHSPFPPQASSREEEEEEEEGMGEPEPSCIAQGSVHANNGQVSAAAASALGASVSFGRFLSESLDWGKWSSFCQKRYLEEAAKHSTPGSVAQKKAFFEARHKKKLATELEQLDVDHENRKSTGNLMELTKPLPDNKPLEEIYVDDQNGSGSNIEKNRGESTTPISGKKNKPLVNFTRSRAGSTTPLSNKRSPVMKKASETKASSNGVSKFASLTPHSQHGRIGSPLKQTPSTRKQVDVKMPSIGYSNLSSIKGHRAEIEVGSPSNSFKTNGKVEKKKEFFNNLENKVVRKEVRKLQLQGTPKEISGNRIKELSQSLCFKARPLPDFYRNTGLVKHEAKKTPLQRPQSPQSRKEQPQSKTKTKLSSVNAGSRKWQVCSSD